MMGLMKPVSECRVSEESGSADRQSNPDPRNYDVINLMRMGEFVVVRVRYPDCTNYEGVKVLVFDIRHFDYLEKCAATKKVLRYTRPLDPHFCGSARHPTPVARFKPDREGMKMALAFCRSYRKGGA